jgi:hypothetical protein
MNQFFVLGIGGTGMRCIESLLHLCAMGMFDNTELHLLALDTDKNNGNFARLKEVKEAYCRAKGSDAAARTPLQDTFFSANVKYYEFSPNYDAKSTFQEVFDYGGTQYNRREETDLADLVLTKQVEEFNLRHGYRAQTHLGSMMMYHAILEAAESPVDNELKSFLAQLTKAAQNGAPKVFILGSVFGGTGASSIPIIPQAISRAAERMNGGSVNVLRNAYFGSTLLTAYFSFKTPTGSELSEQKVIATSDKFALNSQVAMMFYDDDANVRSTYQRFYMLGTDSLSWDPMAQRAEGVNKTITGGAEQKNDSHYIELLAACAALDFYNTNDERLKEKKQHADTDYIYRAISEDGRFEFEDFVGQQRAEEFARKFGTLLAFALFCNGEDDFVESVRCGGQKEITEFTGMEVTQVEYLKKYFALLFFTRGEGRLAEGWVQQLHRSAGGGDRFLFNASLFGFSTFKELMKVDWNKELYRNEGLGKDNNYKKSGIFSGSKFDPFKKAFIAERENTQGWKAITNRGEQLYKLVYDTLGKLYQFN